MWDKRGDLPVHVLNRLLVEFKLWEEVPTIMLVGNHDQVHYTASIAMITFKGSTSTH